MFCIFFLPSPCVAIEALHPFLSAHYQNHVYHKPKTNSISSNLLAMVLTAYKDLVKEMLCLPPTLLSSVEQLW